MLLVFYMSTVYVNRSRQAPHNSQPASQPDNQPTCDAPLLKGKCWTFAFQSALDRQHTKFDL
jgi:hypothetical protein